MCLLAAEQTFSRLPVSEMIETAGRRQVVATPVIFDCSYSLPIPTKQESVTG